MLGHVLILGGSAPDSSRVVILRFIGAIPDSVYDDVERFVRETIETMPEEKRPKEPYYIRLTSDKRTIVIAESEDLAEFLRMYYEERSQLTSG